MKPLSASVELPCDVETTYATLTGPWWPELMAERLHDGSALVEAAPTADGGARLVVSRRLPEGTPGFLSALLPQDGRVTQTDVWGPAGDGARRGTWSATFPGSPAALSGQTTVEPTAGGSRWTVRGSVTVKVPLVGGRAEGFLAPLVERLVQRQGEVLREAVSRA